MIASAGVDARIVELVEGDAGTKGLGQLAYPLVGVSLAGALHGVPTRVWFDDESPIELDLLAGIVTNGRLYGGLVPMMPSARIDDGALDVALFPGGGAVDATAHVARVLAGLHLGDPNVLIRTTRRLRVEPIEGRTLPVQSDGDPLGTTPLQVEVIAGALLALGADQGDGPST